MPIRAFLHFYEDKNVAEEIIRVMCQCPFGLLFISTEEKISETLDEIMCQCPFGLLFISTAGAVVPGEDCRVVSMPIRASLDFH